MSRSAADITPLADLAHGRSRTGPVRDGRPVYVDLLPPCNAGCPGGQMSKATPLGAVAKFAAAGKTVPTKDLALQRWRLYEQMATRGASEFPSDPRRTGN